MHRYAITLTLATLIFGLFLIREIALGTLAKVDDTFLDWLIANSSTPPLPAPEVAVVELGDATRERTLTPLEFSLFLNTIAPFSPAMVVAEPVLNWDPPQKEGEQMILQRVLTLPSFIAGCQLGSGPIPESDRGGLPDNFTVLRNYQGDVSKIPEFRTIAHQPFEELTLIGTRGLTENFPPNHIFRRYSLLYRYRGELTPSIVLQTVMLWLKLTPPEVTIFPGKSIHLGSSIQIPIDETGAMLLNRTLSGAIPRQSVDDLHYAAKLHQEGKPNELPLFAIQKGITFFGKNCPFEAKPWQTQSISMIHTLATAVATIQTRLFIQTTSLSVSFIILGGLVLGIFFSAYLRKGISLLLYTAGLTSYIICALSIFHLYRLWLPIALPLLVLSFAGMIRLFFPNPKSGTAPSLTSEPTP